MTKYERKIQMGGWTYKPWKYIRRQIKRFIFNEEKLSTEEEITL